MLAAFFLLGLGFWIGRLTSKRGGDSKDEADAEVALVLLILDHLANWQPKDGYYLRTEIEQVAGSLFQVWLGSEVQLEKKLSQMVALRLIDWRVSERGQAQTQNSDTPREYRVATAGLHLLEKGLPTGFRPPAAPPPSGLPNGT